MQILALILLLILIAAGASLLALVAIALATSITVTSIFAGVTTGQPSVALKTLFLQLGALVGLIFGTAIGALISLLMDQSSPILWSAAAVGGLWGIAVAATFNAIWDRLLLHPKVQ